MRYLVSFGDSSEFYKIIHYSWLEEGSEFSYNFVIYDDETKERKVYSFKDFIDEFVSFDTVNCSIVSVKQERIHDTLSFKNLRVVYHKDRTGFYIFVARPIDFKILDLLDEPKEYGKFTVDKRYSIKGLFIVDINLAPIPVYRYLWSRSRFVEFNKDCVIAGLGFASIAYIYPCSDVSLLKTLLAKASVLQ